MHTTILRSLQKIEQQHQVKILYACESGSRVWGFPSEKSDYDVRFLYVHRKEDYLSIDPIGVGKKRDVIELPVNSLLDINGWELAKALRLFRKANPPLLEWLHSPIVYYEAFSIAQKLKSFSQTDLSLASCLHHYVNMARTNYLSLQKSEPVKVKLCFSVLRPLLAAKWIEEQREFPPLLFHTLVKKLIKEKELQAEISRLVEWKITGRIFLGQLDTPLLQNFFHEEINRLINSVQNKNPDRTNITPELDQMFRDTIKKAWE